MFMGIWSAVIGLVFGWCAMLFSADKALTLWVRAGLSAAVGVVAAFLFDYVAFDNANAVFAVVGGALGGAGAAVTHQAIAPGLERRPRRKPDIRPHEGR